MREGNKRFRRGLLTHCYQRSKDGCVLFYDDADRLSMFTVMCRSATRHGIKLVSVCLMPDHIHFAAIASDSARLSGFVRDYSSAFAKDYDLEYGLRGSVFSTPYGSAVKNGDKAARTNIIYIFRNPVERRLCEEAGKYRWNFMAYAINSSPFSQPVPLRYASAALRRSLKYAEILYKQGSCLTIGRCRSLLNSMSFEDRQRFIDYVVCLYSVLDHGYVKSLFGNYLNLVHAVNYSKGSEYDINEIFTGRSDKLFDQIGQMIVRTGNPADIHDLFRITPERRFELFEKYCEAFPFQINQVAKYFHLELRGG